MGQYTDQRGFRGFNGKNNSLLIKESSAIGDYEDSLDCPGSSYLWIGSNHLDREEVNDLIEKLQYWLKNKRLHAG